MNGTDPLGLCNGPDGICTNRTTGELHLNTSVEQSDRPPVVRVAPSSRRTCFCETPFSTVAAAIGPSASWKYAQSSYSPSFSNNRKTPSVVRGRPVAEVATELEKGELSSNDLPVELGVINETTLILNTRSALALTQAGIPRSEWNVIDVSGNNEAMARLEAQLSRNGLTSAGFEGVPSEEAPPDLSIWELLEDSFGEGGDTDG